MMVGMQIQTRPTARRYCATFFVLALFGVICATSTAAMGQRSTEQFIPIGQSPGLSGIVTYTGEIAEIDPSGQTITVRGPAGSETVTVTVSRRTRIWLDRSSIGLPSLPGKFADLGSGSVVEIHFQSAVRRQTADWIKVASDRQD